MKYITGIHALNLRCSLETCGDWHQPGIQWKNLTIRESEDSVFGDYGIEDNSLVPDHPGTHKVANHISSTAGKPSSDRTGMKGVYFP